MSYIDEDELFKAIVYNMEKKLDTRVLPEVRKLQQKNIDEVIYNSYEPKVYVRRKYLGLSTSLYNEENIKGFISGMGTWSFLYRIVNTTNPSKPYNDYLTPMLVMGYGSKDKPYNKPRDFIKPTQREVDNINFEKLLKS